MKYDMRTIAAATMIVSSLLVALVSWRFLFMGFEGAFGDVDVFAAFLQTERLWFIAHVIGAPVALFLGGLQLINSLRQRLPSFHRWSGRMAVLAMVIGGLAGLGLSVASFYERPIAVIGFIALGVFWIGSAIIGVIYALKRQFEAHRKWMIYAFALTFSAVTFRVHLAIGFGLGFEYEAITNVVGWTCWVPNVMFAAWYLHKNPTMAPTANSLKTGPASAALASS